MSLVVFVVIRTAELISCGSGKRLRQPTQSKIRKTANGSFALRSREPFVSSMHYCCIALFANDVRLLYRAVLMKFLNNLTGSVHRMLYVICLIFFSILKPIFGVIVAAPRTFSSRSFPTAFQRFLTAKLSPANIIESLLIRTRRSSTYQLDPTGIEQSTWIIEQK